jgi:hypothetical protein
MPKYPLWKHNEKFDVKQYKKEYYIKNNIIYTERNRLASQERTIKKIEELSTEDILYKLAYIVNHG